ncbi:MAG: hypothetical protein H6819_00485 [Phycisphaerales bacterium]|nr:hypothetical protein [Phycisphaerales bacterium]MCB9857314.1 hypothetical protein [Phycisphaerales bacterium]MCB9862972.1 hypothetical protein [Phycisphaerales bacterium]
MNTDTEPTSGLSEAIESIRRVRSTLAAVIEGIPGFKFRRPNDLSAELGLDPKLAWNLGRCIEESDPLAAAQFLPGPTGIQKFLSAAIRRNVPQNLANAVRAASVEFNDVVRRQAGTRKNFNILVSGNSSRTRISADVEHRRRAFEGNSYIWGVHAQTIFRSNIVMPSEDSDRWDLATIRGMVDFCCLRANVAWRITLPVSVDADRIFHHDVRREPIDPKVSPRESILPLMLDYCTQPVPKFRAVRGAFGQEEYEFVSSSVGLESRITCVTGEVLRRVEPRYRNDVYDDFCMTFPIRTPANTLVFDLVIHRDIFDSTQGFRAQLYSDLFAGGPGLYYEESDQLPMREQIEYLGRGSDVFVTPDIPGYDRMIQHTMERCGCDDRDYDAYRVRIDYPPIATQLMIRRPLPSQPR